MIHFRVRRPWWIFVWLALAACNPATPSPLPPSPTPVPPAEVKFVDATTAWRYIAQAVPTPGWQSDIAFDDGDWQTGLAPIGNMRPARTFVEPETNAQSLYLRAKFNVTDPAAWRGLRLQLDYVSGAAAYLNGMKIVLANLDAQATSTDFALVTHDTPDENFDVSQALKALHAGPNLLAIEVHRRVQGGDLRAGAELVGIPLDAPPYFVLAPVLGRLGSQTVSLQAESDVSATAILEYAPSASMTTTLTFSPTVQHRIMLNDLQPGTTYAYRLGLQTEHGTTWSQPGQWTTDGGAAQAFQFAVWGSNAPRSGSSVPPVFAQLITALDSRGPLAFGVTLGDSLELLPGVPDEATIRTRYLNYLDAIQPLTRHMPLYPVIGNHDNPDCESCVRAFLNYYLLPEQNDRTYYSFDYGPAHLVVLNTRQRGGTIINYLSDEQWQWLQADLKHTTQPVKLVFMHDDLFHGAPGTPPRFSTKDQGLLHTLFRDSGVVAVFQADAHYYDYSEKNGIAYVITGGATDELFVQPYKAYWEQSQALVIRVTQTQIEIEAIMPDGLTLDQHALSVPKK